MIMKKLITLLLTFTMLTGFAQKGRYNSVDAGKQFPGFMVTEKHDTVKGSFMIYLPEVMQAGCQMRDASGNELYGNTWNNIICYEIENDTKWYSTKFTTIKAPKDPKRFGGGAETFVLVVEKGPITLFDYFFVDGTATPEVREQKSYMQLPSGEVIDVSSMLMGFAKKMPGYVKDFPELADKITKKEKGYGFTNINAVIREYNAWYMSKNPDFTIFK